MLFVHGYDTLHFLLVNFFLEESAIRVWGYMLLNSCPVKQCEKEEGTGCRNLYQFCKSPQFCIFSTIKLLYKLLYNFSALFRLELTFIGFYGVLLEFEKRKSVNMQEINSKLWIMGRIMEGAKGFIFIMKMMSFPFEIEAS